MRAFPKTLALLAAATRASRTQLRRESPRSHQHHRRFQSHLPGIVAMAASPSEAAAAGGTAARDEAPESGATQSGEAGGDGCAPAAEAAEEPKPPPLTAAQFREYNRMAEHMDYFHSHFRQVWTMMYSACENKKRPAGMSIRQFLDEGLQLAKMLTLHHSIEEAHVFPMLAKRMPEFQQPGKGPAARSKRAGKGAGGAAELVRQHRAIHVGMDAFEDYLRRCRSGETELELSVLKAQMDTWGTVLWRHLDEEVATLGAENMRKYWSLDDMKRMRM